MTRRFRTYRELTGPDRSGLEAQIAEQQARVERRLASVSRVVAVVSGKGGVGKSFLSATLAAALRDEGTSVGLLDADLQGPSAGRMSGLTPDALVVTEDGVRPARGETGVFVMSMSLLLREHAPLEWRGPAGASFVWRGADERNALREFLADVEWGTLDWLVVDLPPGLQRTLDLCDMVPDLAGIVAVTLPAEASGDSVARTLEAVRGRGIPLIGIVENMVGYVCPGCAETRPLFAGGAGERLGIAFGAPVLGRVPFDPRAALLADRGQVLSLLHDTAAGSAVRSLARRLGEEAAQP